MENISLKIIFKLLIDGHTVFVRMLLHINTNMGVKRMYKSLKYGFFDEKKKTQLDKTIHCVLQFIELKVFDRLIVLHKGKVSHTRVAMSMVDKHVDRKSTFLIIVVITKKLHIMINNDTSK